jgi:hypothetical protein
MKNHRKDWLKSYFGKTDSTEINRLEKMGMKDPELFWCKAMLIRYINFLQGMGKENEIQEILELLNLNNRKVD